MWIPQVLISFFETVSKSFDFLSKTQPTPEMSQQIYNDKRAVMLVKDRILIENKIFQKIKNVPDANVESEVRSKTDLSESDTMELVVNITARIKQYRNVHPIISGWRRFTRRNQ